MISTRALPHLWRHSARVTRSQPFRHGRWLSSGVSEPPILRRNLPGVKVRSSLTQRAPRLEPSEGVSSSEAKLDAGEVRADRESMTRRSTRQQQDDNALSDSPTSDLSSMDIFRSIPVPNVTIDACSNTGFVLTGNVPIENSGVFIACGEAFSWSPRECVSLSSEVLPSSQGTSKLELEKDSLGRWNIPLKALSLLEVLWPKPELLIIGTGSSYVPLSSSVTNAVAELGIRIDVCDTRSAAANYNLLATERGINEVAAMMVPLGFV